MTFEIGLVLVIIVGALILFASEVVSIDLTAILIMVLLISLGLVSPAEGVSGFSNSATLTILALLFISLGVQNTGTIKYLGDFMVKYAKGSFNLSLLLVMSITAFLSAFINNTAVVALFLPLIFRFAKAREINVSKLLIPLSFAAMVGGSSTLVGTSTNLLLNTASMDYGFPGFTLFEFTPIGIILFAVLVIYFLAIGTKFLPARRNEADDLTEQYQLKNYLTELLVTAEFPYIGQSLKESPLVKKGEVEILEIVRDDGQVWLPDEVQKFKEHDILVIKTNLKEIVQLGSMPGLSLRPQTKIDDELLTSEESVLVEIVVGANSDLINQKMSDIPFQKLYGAIPLALRRKAKARMENLSKFKIKFGDIILLEAKRQTVEKLYNDQNLIVLQRISRWDLQDEPPRKRKMMIAVGILLLVVLLPILNIFPILVSSWIGVALIFLTGCIELKKAYENVQWSVIFLLAGLIPLGIAMEKTGTDLFLAHLISNLLEGTSQIVTIAVLFAFATVLTSIISNNATVVLLVPVVMQISAALQLDPKLLLLAILFGSNASFLTPMGYQTNVMVYAPGNYRFFDFFKAGGLLCVIFLMVVSLLLPWLYG